MALSMPQPAQAPASLCATARADTLLAEVLAAYRSFTDEERATRMAGILNFLADPVLGPADILQRRALLTFWRCVRDLLALEADGREGIEMAEALERRAVSHLTTTSFKHPADLMPLPALERAFQ